MATYTYKYKCRLCGEVHQGASTTNRDAAMSGVIETSMTGSCTKHGIPVAMIEIHACENGSIGVTDLQGVSKEIEDDA